jgi:hypothetical protein
MFKFKLTRSILRYNIILEGESVHLRQVLPYFFINNIIMYKVFDSLGNFMRSFPTLEQASNYKFINGNSRWRIVKKFRYDRD